MTDIDAQVAQFHRAFGYPVRSVPAGGVEAVSGA